MNICVLFDNNILLLQLINQLRSILVQIQDVDQLITLCVHIGRNENIRIAEYKVTQVINLKQTLQLIDPLLKTISSCHSRLFQGFKNVCLPTYIYYYSSSNDRRRVSRLRLSIER